MRLPATQSLTDGELFYIIENGVRLTGAPAWGTGTPGKRPETRGTWSTSSGILERISDAELERMKELNPRPPGEVLQQLEEERFLKGETTSAPRKAPHIH